MVSFFCLFRYTGLCHTVVKKARSKKKVEVERLNKISPSHQAFYERDTKADGKIYSVYSEPIYKDVKVEVSSLYKFGEPLHDEPSRMSHDQGRGVGVGVGMGVPCMTGFIRALPMVQPPAPTHASTRFPSRHFDVVKAGLIKRESKSFSSEM